MLLKPPRKSPRLPLRSRIQTTYIRHNLKAALRRLFHSPRTGRSMPWQDNSGKGGSGGGTGGGSGRGPVRGPWGQQPPKQPGGGDNGRGGGEPPNLDELLQASSQRFKRAMQRRGGGRGGRGGPGFDRRIGFLIAAGVGALWLMSGFYQVDTAERGVVTSFGKFDRVTLPGLQWRLPSPFQSHRTEVVTKLREMNVPGETGGRGGLMLTGDKNIVDVAFTVQWRIKEDISAPPGMLPPVAQFALMIDKPENLVRAVAEASIREVVGRNELDFLQTEGRNIVQDETRALMQKTLDDQATGIEIASVNLRRIDPPTSEVNAAFLDVIAAGQDREQLINEAKRYANKIEPEARGQAQQVLEDSRAYSSKVVAEARGQAARFDSILNEYQKAPDVTRQRMYLETVEKVIGPMDKIIIEETAGRGVVPYLPLNELRRPPAEGAKP
jgi:membrane protease subunit HflK